MTITAALAEIKTIHKRIESKRAFIQDYLIRPETMKDPHEKDGGSKKLIEETMDSIRDLEQRRIAIRSAIAKSNSEVVVTVGGESKTITEWLIWRREVQPGQENFQRNMKMLMNKARQTMFTPTYGGKSQDGMAPVGVVIEVDELHFSQEIEKLQEIIGDLDGALSIRNATALVEVA